MARKLPFFVFLLCLLLVFASCTADRNDGSTTAAPGESVPYEGQTASDETAATVADPEASDVEVSGEFSITNAEGGAVVPNGNVYTVTAAGEYTAKGVLENGQIVINAGDADEVKLILNGVSVSNGTDAPVLAVNAAEVNLNAADGTYNTVTDSRASITTTDADENNYDAAVYSTCDLKLTGKGTLTVSSAAGNGVKSKDDLKIKNVTLKVTAAENALKGNDSVTVESGSVILISENADGIKTSNTDISAKGNQRGTVSILGGSVDIYAACDGIDAAYNAELAKGESGEPIVNIYTASYASEAENAEYGGELYAIVSASDYSEKSDYYAFFYNDDDADGVWKQFSYESMVYSGRTAYYGLKTNIPAGYANIAFYAVASGQTPDGYTYEACSAGETLNVSMNAYPFNSVSGKQISGDWVQLSSGSGGSNKTTYSSKGIKAANEILISAGTLTVQSMDDARHADAGEALENGKTGLGNISVSGGRISIACADDGMHAEGILNISGGEINVTESHEGLESNVINVSGGRIFVYADDDGLNAPKGNQTPLINITGGYLDVTTPSGDTDGIDSNGNFTMSGGFVLVKSGSTMGGVAGSVDTDGTVTVTGGAIVALGGVCETPGSGSVCTYISSGTSFAAGEYELKDASGNKILSFSLSSDYSSVWIASEDLSMNTGYTLYQDGNEVLSWTQNETTVGSSGEWGPGGGMSPGGMGPGGSPPGGMGHRGG